MPALHFPAMDKTDTQLSGCCERPRSAPDTRAATGSVLKRQGLVSSYSGLTRALTFWCRNSPLAAVVNAESENWAVAAATAARGGRNGECAVGAGGAGALQEGLTTLQWCDAGANAMHNGVCRAVRCAVCACGCMCGCGEAGRKRTRVRTCAKAKWEEGGRKGGGEGGKEREIFSAQRSAHLFMRASA